MTNQRIFKFCANLLNFPTFLQNLIENSKYWKAFSSTGKNKIPNIKYSFKINNKVNIAPSTLTITINTFKLYIFISFLHTKKLFHIRKYSRAYHIFFFFLIKISLLNFLSLSLSLYFPTKTNIAPFLGYPFFFSYGVWLTQFLVSYIFHSMMYRKTTLLSGISKIIKIK